MDVTKTPSSDVAFTAAVKAVQVRKGSRDLHVRQEARGGFRTAVTPDLLAFMAEVDTAYLATTSAGGQPYAQHRGGRKGFIRHVEGDTIGFADYAGNRQYVTTGNLSENGKAFLFMMDYALRRRVKLWGRARTVEADPGLVARLLPEGTPARVEQVVLFDVQAWDVNCPQHIPRKLDATEVAQAFGELQARFKASEAEVRALRATVARLTRHLD